MQSEPKPCVFESELAPMLTAFIAEKQRLGYKYEVTAAYLKSFDAYLIGKDCKNGLTEKIMLEWIAPKAHQKPTTVKHNIYTIQGAE